MPEHAHSDGLQRQAQGSMGLNSDRLRTTVLLCADDTRERQRRGIFCFSISELYSTGLFSQKSESPRRICCNLEVMNDILLEDICLSKVSNLERFCRFLVVRLGRKIVKYLQFKAL